MATSRIGWKRAAQIGGGVASRLRSIAFRASGMTIRGHCWLRAIEWPLHPSAITLEPGVMLDRGVVLLATDETARIVLGARCYINRHTILDASELVEIGAESMIGPFCYITDHDHTPALDAPPADGPLVSAPTRIGDRCWLGAHVSVLKGVSIGDGAVIGAGSIVTKSVPAGVIAVGNPARVLRPILG